MSGRWDLRPPFRTGHGSRGGAETLKVGYRGCNVAKVLALTVDRASRLPHRPPWTRPGAWAA